MNPLQAIDPELYSLVSGGSRVARQRQQQQPAFTDEDEQTVLGALRDKSIGTLAAAGNVLDLPASMVRDTITGNNPFDQLLPWNWTSSDNRATGRDIARQFGMAGRRDTWGNAIGGFGLEVALDPLTYMTFGASALGKSGQAAKAAGLMDDVATVAARKAGVKAGTVGKRQQRLGTTLQDILDFGDEPARMKAKSLIDEGADATESLGGMAGIGLPFMEPMQVVGTGPKSLQAAKFLDDVGQGIRFAKVPGTDFAPMDATARLFDASIQGTKTAFGQATARKTTREKQKVGAAARQRAIQLGERFRVAGIDDEQFGDLLRAEVEGVDAATISSLPTDMQARYGEAMTKIAAIPGGMDELQSVAGDMRGYFDSLLDRSKQSGLKLSDLNEAGGEELVKYMPRFLAADLGIKQQNDRRLLASFDPSQKARADELRNVPAGTYAVKEIFRDPNVRRIKDEIATGAQPKEALQQYLEKTHGGWLSDAYKVYDDKKGVWEDTTGRYTALANRMLALKPETLELGVFGNHPIVDAEVRFLSAENAIKSAENMRDALLQPKVMKSDDEILRAGESLNDYRTVREIVLDAGLKYGNEDEGFMRLLQQQMPGQSIADIGNMRVRKDEGEDLLKLMNMATAQEPVQEWLKVVDGITNFGKGMWTNVWPAFHVRNFVSGTAHNWFKGMVNLRSLGQAWNYMTGGNVSTEDMLKNRAVRQELYNRGYDIDPNAGKSATGAQPAQGPQPQGGTQGVVPDVMATPAGHPDQFSPEFKNWFGDFEAEPQSASKVVDEFGAPKVMYHGTGRPGFNEFDTYGSNYGLFGNGSYFTDSPDIAGSYTKKGSRKIKQGGNEPSAGVYPVYLSIRNPLDMDAPADPARWSKIAGGDYTPTEGMTNEDVYRMIEEDLSDQRIPHYEGAEMMQDYIRSMGHDGVTHIGGGRVAKDGVRHRVYIAFDPEQIKSATGNRGTFDPSDPNILATPARGNDDGFRVLDDDEFNALSTPDKRKYMLALNEYEKRQAIAKERGGAAGEFDAMDDEFKAIVDSGDDGMGFMDDMDLDDEDFVLDLSKSDSFWSNEKRQDIGPGDWDFSAPRARAASAEAQGVVQELEDAKILAIRPNHLDRREDAARAVERIMGLFASKPQAMGMKLKSDTEFAGIFGAVKEAIADVFANVDKRDLASGRAIPAYDEMINILGRGGKFHREGVVGPLRTLAQTLKNLDEWDRVGEPFEKLVRSLVNKDGFNVYDPKLERLVASAGKGGKFDQGLMNEIFGAAPPRSGPADTLATPAYHGSPHKFNKFSTEHIGSGEGAQAYGWGMYFAGDEEVARHYRERLSRGSVVEPEILAKYFEPGSIVPSYGGYDRVISFDPGDGERSWSVTVQKLIKKDGKWVDDELEPYPRVHYTSPDARDVQERFPDYKPGALYKVDLKPEEDEYLLWDESIANQSQKVKDAIAKAVPESLSPYFQESAIGEEFYQSLSGEEFDWTIPWLLGEAIARDHGLSDDLASSASEALEEFAKGNFFNYQTLEKVAKAVVSDGHSVADVNKFMNSYADALMQFPQTPEQASKLLLSHGIRGIKFLDGNTRKAAARAKREIKQLQGEIEQSNTYTRGLRKERADNESNPGVTPAYFERLDREIATQEKDLASLQGKLAQAEKTAQGSSNYVVFDDADVEVESVATRKGKPSPVVRGLQSPVQQIPNVGNKDINDWTIDDINAISDPANFSQISPQHKLLNDHLEKLVKQKGIKKHDAQIMRLIYAQSNAQFMPKKADASVRPKDFRGRHVKDALGFAEPEALFGKYGAKDRVALLAQQPSHGGRRGQSAYDEGTRVLLHEMAHIAWFAAKESGNYDDAIREFIELGSKNQTKLRNEFLNVGQSTKQARYHAGMDRSPNNITNPEWEQFAEFFAQSAMRRKIPTGAIGTIIKDALRWLKDALVKLGAIKGLDPDVRKRMDEIVDMVGGFDKSPDISNIRAKAGAGGSTTGGSATSGPGGSSATSPPVNPPVQPPGPAAQPPVQPPIPVGPAGPAVPPGGRKKVTPEAVTQLFREMLYAHQVIGKFEGNAADVVGRAGNLQGGSLEDMLSGTVAPGQSAMQPGRVVRKFTGTEPGTSRNPFKSTFRGLGDATESTWGPSAAGEEVGYFVEGMNRVAPFYHMLAQGIDPAEAAKRVADAQVNYSNRNFTPFEQQVMKRLMPFYSFSSRVGPEVVKEIAQRPGGRLATAVKAQAEMQDQGDTAPDYVRETASFPLGDMLGPVPEGTDRYLTGLGLMHEDPFSFGPNVKGAMLELGSRMNPFVKAPLEYMTGQSFFQKGPDGGRSLDDMDPLVGRLAANVGLVSEDNVKFLPTAVEQFIANSPAARALSTARQLTDERKQWSEDIPLPGPAALLNTLTGIRVTDVSPGSKDAIVRELLEREMKDTGAAAFERIYYRKDDLAKMSPEERESSLRLQALANVLAKRAKERKERKQAEEQQ